jgi:hypothetical protein
VSLRSRATWLAFFATAMGWLEAVVVVYLRSMLGMQHGEAMPSGAEVMARIQSLPWLLPVEQGREAATMVMLASVAWLGGDQWRSRFGVFLMIFGIWDIAYYVGLFAMAGWPRSLFAMDVLFLIPPHPWWYQPVGLPVGISCLMIGTGLKLMAPRSRVGAA